MIEKLIENWLINTNELSYQIPFCEVLLAQGYQIIYISPHGRGEHGKDVIARDSNNRLCTFQLKGGKINLTEWRKIRGEVEELARQPVRHPGISKSEQHFPHLVTNGDFIGDANNDIRYFSELWEADGANPLVTWNKHQLQEMFVKAHGKYLPTHLDNFRLFVELYVADFSDIFPRLKFASLLEELSSSERVGKRRTQIKRAVESVVLVGAYIIEQYEREENFIAAIIGWTIVAANIMQIATRERVARKYFEPSLNLVWLAVERNFKYFEEEVLSRESFIDNRAIFAEPFFYNVRVAIILSWLAAFQLIKLQKNEGYTNLKAITDVFRREMRRALFLGDVDWPGLMSIAIYLEKQLGTRFGALNIVNWIKKIQRHNFGENPKGIASPYWLHQEIIELEAGLKLPHEKENFAFHSYSSLSALDMLVRRFYRSNVRTWWPDMSKITFTEFKPRNMHSWFLWNNRDEGKLRMIVPPETVSWKKWRNKVMTLSSTKIPPILLDNPQWILPFALTYPHRVTRTYSALIDTVFGEWSELS